MGVGKGVGRRGGVGGDAKGMKAVFVVFVWRGEERRGEDTPTFRETQLPEGDASRRN